MSIYGHLLTESYSPLTIEESVLLQEMNAKKIDLDDFKDAGEAIKYIGEYYYNVIKTCSDVLDEIAGRVGKAKTSEALAAVHHDIIKKYPERTKAAYGEYDALKGGQGATSFMKLRRVCSKFKMKYSDEAMEEKKKLDSELNAIRDKVLTLGREWVQIQTADGKTNNKTPKLDVLQKALDDAKKVDEDYWNQIFGAIKGLYQLLCQEVGATINDIYATRKMLKLDKENKLMYKIVNKLFKTKKSTNESVQLNEFVEYVIESGEEFESSVQEGTEASEEESGD